MIGDRTRAKDGEKRRNKRDRDSSRKGQGGMEMRSPRVGEGERQ